MELREYFREVVQLMALLVYQVAGKDDKVCLLSVSQVYQLPDSFRVALPTAYVYVRQLEDAVTVEPFGKLVRTVFHLLYLEAGNACDSPVQDVDEANAAQYQPQQGIGKPVGYEGEAGLSERRTENEV